MKQQNPFIRKNFFQASETFKTNSLMTDLLYQCHTTQSFPLHPTQHSLQLRYSHPQIETKSCLYHYYYYYDYFSGWRQEQQPMCPVACLIKILKSFIPKLHIVETTPIQYNTIYYTIP